MRQAAPAKAAFDEVAAGYDARFTDQPLARHLRAGVMERTLRLLPPDGGAKVLEVGCGTGEDAAVFARHGHRVLATDAAPGMIQLARKKIAAEPLADTGIWQVGQPVPDLVAAQAPFDLLFSNFGAMNCVEDLSGFGRDCARLVSPGGHVVVVLINRWCLMEILLGAVRLDRASMTRRFRKRQVTQLEDGTRLAVQFPSRREMAAHMRPGFTQVDARAVGVFIPPSEYYSAFQKRPWLMRLVRRLDRVVGGIWPFGRLADHELLVFQRKRVANDTG